MRLKRVDKLVTDNKGKRKMVLINNKISWVGIKYDPSLPKLLVNYFDKPLYRKVKNKVSGVVEKIASDYPTISAFRAKYKIPKATWYDWVNTYPELKDAVDIISDMKEAALKINGLNGGYAPVMAKFIAMNDLGMSDKSEVKQTGIELTDEQKKKLMKEYMEDIKDGSIIVLDDNNLDVGKDVGEMNKEEGDR